MPGVAVHVRRAVAVSGLVMTPIAIHVSMATQRWVGLAGILVVLQTVLVACVALSFFVPNRSLRWCGCAAAATLTTAIWQFMHNGILVSSAVPHAVTYITLLAFFAMSLAPGRKAIVTILADKARGPLSPAVVLYTRRVTWAWCLFCAGRLVGSLLLLLFAPASVWSMFVNLFNLPLIIAMFCAEFAYRKWRHGARPQERLSDIVRLAGHMRTIATNDAV